MPEVEWRMEVEQEWVEWVEMERKQGGRQVEAEEDYMGPVEAE